MPSRRDVLVAGTLFGYVNYATIASIDDPLARKGWPFTVLCAS